MKTKNNLVLAMLVLSVCVLLFGCQQSCKISFDTNGATAAIPTQIIEIGKTVTEPETAPVKDGYRFTGWYTDEECKELYDFTSEVEINFTLYAGWEQLFTLTYIVGDSTQTKLLAAGDELGLEAPVKDGFIFDGWYCNGEKFEGKMPANDLTVEAHFTAQTFSISFDLNGGVSDKEISAIDVALNETIVLPNTHITKTADNKTYHFEGWKINEKVYAPGSEYTIESIGNAIFTASYIEAKTISSAKELDRFYRNLGNEEYPLNGCYILTRDISWFNDSSWGEDDEPGDIEKLIGTNDKPFTGVFDGNGFAITDLSFLMSDDTIDNGVFGVIKDATICNLTIKSADYWNCYYIGTFGALVGKAINSNIYNCSVMSIYAESLNAYYDNSVIPSSSNIGGMIGYAEGSFINNCKVNAITLGGNLYDMDGGENEVNLGGLIGKVVDTKVFNGNAVISMNFGSFGGDNFGGVIGEVAGNSKVTNLSVGGSAEFYDVRNNNNGCIGGIIGKYSSNTEVSKLWSNEFELTLNQGTDYLSDKGVYNVGGVIGYISNLESLEINHVYFKGNITLNSMMDCEKEITINLGGIIGYSQCKKLTLSQTYYCGTLSASVKTELSIAGIIGKNDTAAIINSGFTSCSIEITKAEDSTAVIKANAIAGVGASANTITNMYIDAENSYTGIEASAINNDAQGQKTYDDFISSKFLNSIGFDSEWLINGDNTPAL